MIAVIQYRADESEQHERDCYKKHLPGVELDFLPIYDPNVDFESPGTLLEKYDKVIIGGSGEILLSENNEQAQFIFNRTKPLIKYVVENDFPTLGVCFGNQLIGKYLGVPIDSIETMGEAGLQTVSITKTGLADPLFAGVENPLAVAMGHKDSMLTLPKDSKHLAYSAICQTQAFRVGEKVYGVQFHVELDENDLQDRLKLYPHYEALQLGYDAKGSKQGPKVLQNFASL